MARDLEEELRLAADANSQLRRDIVKLKQRLEVLQLREENASLAHGLSFKVSDKAAVSVYGLQAMPTTLYKDQWERLLLAAQDIRKFIKENEPKLITKAESKTRPDATRKLVRFKR